MKMRAPLTTAFAIAIGLIVLLKYFTPAVLLENSPFLTALFSTLIGWGVSLAAVAALVGIFNLIIVHWRKIRAKEGRDPYSPILILAFLVTFGVGIWLTPGDPRFQQVVTSIQVPVETSLMAVLAVTLTFASLRLLQHRKDILSVVFLISALVFLLFTAGLLGVLQPIPLIGNIVGFINRLPIAGARGILLGIALGSLTAGLRILLGADRPYSG